MLHVTLNKQEGHIEVKGNLVSFVATGTPVGGEATERFAASEVTQLLRSRKNDRVAKIVTEGGKSYVTQFDSITGREGFVEALVQAQAASRGADVAAPPTTATATSSGSETTEQWVSRAICQAAVDVGALSRSELQGIIDEDNHRGVVQVFDALEALVDRDTLQLKPLTESMENDVLRQIPILAVIFERYVMDEETKRSFWEAVVRKYFCFSRTFLEEELEKVERDAADLRVAAVTEAPSDAKGGETTELSAINGASWRALPKLTEATAALAAAEEAAVDEDSEEARAVRASEAAEAGEEINAQDRFIAYFRPKRTLRTLSGDFAPPAIRPRRAYVEEEAPTTLFAGRAVAHALPMEPAHKDALETVRRFWRAGDATHREAILLQYEKKHTGDARRESLIEATCLAQAKAFLHTCDNK